jgi:hypothetical protein
MRGYHLQHDEYRTGDANDERAKDEPEFSHGYNLLFPALIGKGLFIDKLLIGRA